VSVWNQNFFSQFRENRPEEKVLTVRQEQHLFTPSLEKMTQIFVLEEDFFGKKQTSGFMLIAVHR
jgi:hypothetical protein